MLGNGSPSCLVWILVNQLPHKDVCNVTTPVFTFVYQLICPSNWRTKANKVWAVPDSLATTTGIVVYFLFLALLRCFSSGGYLHPALCVQTGVIRHYSNRVSPFGHPRFIAYVAAPRGFSQLITSFFGITCQGILCARLSNFLRNSVLDTPKGFSPRCKHREPRYRFKCNWLVIGMYYPAYTISGSNPNSRLSFTLSLL